MWKILSWVAVGLLGVAAFFSYKNVPQFRAERQLLEIAKSNAQQAKNHLKQAEDDLAADKIGRKKSEDQRDALEKQVTESKTKGDDLARQIGERKTELEQVTARWAQMKKQVDDSGGVDEVKRKLGELQQEKANLDQEVSSLKQKIAIASERTAQLSQQAVNLRTREAWQAQGIIPDSFRSRIRAVDNNWGFIIIDGGNRSGVVSGATLDIRRGGSVIGQARVTNVEQNRAVADIIRGSVSEGAEIQPGDSVSVAQISKASQWKLNAQPAAPAQPAAAPGTPAAPGAPPFPAEGTPPGAPAPVDPFADPAVPPPPPPAGGTSPAPAPAEPAVPPADPAAPAAPTPPPGTPTPPPADPFAN